MHGCPKLLMVKWLGISVTVGIRVRDREWTSFLLVFSILKSDKHLCLVFLA